MSSLGVALVVQGEGRGHMTQALALGGFLRDAGHEITAVLVGAPVTFIASSTSF